jgi:hypothetical protein
MHLLRSMVVFVVLGFVAAAAVTLVLFPEADRPKMAKKPSSNQRLIAFEEFSSLPLETPQAAVMRRFGTPLRTAPAGSLDPGARCVYYKAPAGSAYATEYQLCFLAGKLHSKFAG